MIVKFEGEEECMAYAEITALGFVVASSPCIKKSTETNHRERERERERGGKKGRKERMCERERMRVRVCVCTCVRACA